MKLKLGIGIAMAALVIALTGCASGAEGGARQTFMQKCFANATTETERNECAWRNAARMSSGN